MAFTKRELSLLILTATALLLWIGDQYILSPVWAGRQEVSRARQEIAAQVAESENIVQKSGPAAIKQWKQMVEEGLYDDPAKTESMVFSYLSKTSTTYGVVLSSIQPDYGIREKGVGTLLFTVSGTGHALKVYEFIWDIETSELPILLETVHISSKDANSGQVSLQLKMSAIYTYQEQENEGK